MNKKILTIVASLIVIGLFGYLVYKMESGASITNSIPASSLTQTAFSIPGWQTCNYPSFGFRFEYPSDWNVYVYSAHQGMGNIPVKENCGDIDANELNPEITLAASPDWSGGIQIVAARSPQSFGSSTETLGGKPSYKRSDGTVFANGYQISFGQNVSTSTRDSILRTFQFISQ